MNSSEIWRQPHSKRHRFHIPTQEVNPIDLERGTVSISQTPMLDHSPKSEVEYVKGMPFGLEKTDTDPLEGLGRVFDPYHGGEDMYIYSKFLAQRSPVVLSFARFDVDVFMATGEITRNWTAYGSLYEHQNNNFITMVLHPDTQYPSIELLIKRENGSTVNCRIFANSLKLLSNLPQLGSYSGNEIRLDRLGSRENQILLGTFLQKGPDIGSDRD